MESLIKFAFEKHLYVFGGIYLVGFLFALRSLFVRRSPQASVAWLLGLIFLPLISVPFYVFFGARKINSYRKLRRHKEASVLLPILDTDKSCQYRNADKELQSLANLYSRLTSLPMMRAHSLRVYTKGEDFFSSLKASLESAKVYILLEFYIIEEDEVGQKLQDLLIKKASEGVKVYCIYDALGSNLSNAYIKKMRESGVVIEAPERKSWSRKVQINFRNHRKIVVVDGVEAYVGGYNIGNDYAGSGGGSKKFKSWRDTHISFRGEAVQAVQMTFLEDYYACGATIKEMTFLKVNWSGEQSNESTWLHVLPTGPADYLDRALVLVQSLIHKASTRLWISSPYFVVDETVMAALKVAILKGVDVRLLIPHKADHLLVKMAAEPLIRSLAELGVKIYEYDRGFNHQKTWVVDDDLAMIGSLNLDNRSIHLNFELSLVFFDNKVNQQLADDFIRDTEGLSPVRLSDLKRKPFWYKSLSHIANMFAPLL